MGDLYAAKQCYEKQLFIKTSHFYPDHSIIANCYRKPGLVRRALGELPATKESFEKGLANENEQPDPTNIAITLLFTINLDILTMTHEFGDLCRN